MVIQLKHTILGLGPRELKC